MEPLPACPKCENGNFVATSYKPLNAYGSVQLLVCTKCRSILGVLPESMAPDAAGARGVKPETQQQQ